jgi:hypothetical protein
MLRTFRDHLLSLNLHNNTFNSTGTMRLFALALALNVLAGLDLSSAEELASDPTTIILGSNGTITLRGNSSTSEVILDYGANVEGFPTFEIISVSGDTSGLQITYSESLAVLLSSSTVRLSKANTRVQLADSCRAMVRLDWPLPWIPIELITTTLPSQRTKRTDSSREAFATKSWLS